ncbi:Cat26 [Halyomorpha halys]|nr:Cat26 [Halyomorpha halys]
MKILLISSLLLVAAHGGPVHEDTLKEIIETVNSSGAKWKAGQNFGEQTTISSLVRLLGARRDNILKLPLRAKHTIPDSDIPDSFDARENWPQCDSIRHIRDQGTCGSCWAVAAAGAFTDRLCIATNGTFTMPLSAEELLLLPVAQSVASGVMEVTLKMRGGISLKMGCQPYEIQPCEHHVKGELPSCDSLPMSETPKCQRKCTNTAYSTSFSSDHHKIKHAYTVVETETEIQKEIMAHGPVEVTFSVYADFLTYKSGVYHHVTGKMLAGHAVKIIGWGVEDGTPYWLIANQWNESWGDKGLFKIWRGRNECEIESYIVAGIPKI